MGPPALTPEAAATTGAPRPDPRLTLVFEDPALLVVNKPADLVCHPTKGDAWSSLISRLRLHCGDTAVPQLINRLDRETSGLVVCTKTPDAARELRQLWETRQVAKRYLAIVHGAPPAGAGEIDAPLGRDLASAVAIKDCVRPDGAAACTRWRLARTFSRPEGVFSLLEVEPLTGRKHQIRIHLAHLGHPVVGDKLYGGEERCYLDFVEGRLAADQRARLLLRNQALHADRLAFQWRGVEWRFTTPPEPEFTAFLAGGSAPGAAPASDPRPRAETPG